jgi:hypothetical protein
MEMGRYDVLRHLGEYALTLSTRRNRSPSGFTINPQSGLWEVSLYVGQECGSCILMLTGPAILIAASSRLI